MEEAGFEEITSLDYRLFSEDIQWILKSHVNLLKRIRPKNTLGEQIDKIQIGILGYSYGGNTVIFQMALNEEIAFGCASGAACTYKQKMQEGK